MQTRSVYRSRNTEMLQRRSFRFSMILLLYIEKYALLRIVVPYFNVMQTRSVDRSRNTIREITEK